MKNLVNKIKLGGKDFEVINLSKSLTLNQEVYPGDPKPQRKKFSDIKETGWHHYIHEIGDHNFLPHADAPNHQNADMKDFGIEFFTSDYFFNSAFMIDLAGSERSTKIDGIKYLVEIKKEDLVKYEELLKIKTAVLLRTGYDKWLEDNRPHNPGKLPFLSKAAADYIAKFNNLKVVGIDSLTVDPVGKHEAHQALKNLLIVESMVGLYQIPQEKRENFDLQTSPIIIEGATGAPVVANALIAV